MTAQSWMKEMRFNIGIIDAQHTALAEKMDELIEVVEADNMALALKKLGDLRLFSMSHCANEEALMNTSGYPEIKEHIVQHRILKAKLDELKIELCIDSKGVSRELLLRLEKWLRRHISEHDRGYADFVQARKEKKS